MQTDKGTVICWFTLSSHLVHTKATKGYLFVKEVWIRCVSCEALTSARPYLLRSFDRRGI